VEALWNAARGEPYNPEMLATVARFLAASDNAAVRDGPNALVLALKANELTHSLQPNMLDTLGMAFAETGDFANAAICAQNALAQICPIRPAPADLFRQRLERYQNHQPWRESLAAIPTTAP
jgi:hypothetical protein